MMIRIVLAVIGWILIIVGAIVTPMPIPLGIPMMIIGIALVAPTSPMVRRLVAKLRRRFPKLDAALEKAHRRVPRFVQVFIEQTRPSQLDDHKDGEGDAPGQDDEDGDHGAGRA